MRPRPEPPAPTVRLFSVGRTANSVSVNERAASELTYDILTCTMTAILRWEINIESDKYSYNLWQGSPTKFQGVTDNYNQKEYLTVI